jgi:hypothetical protein
MNTVKTKALESTRLVVDLESTWSIVYECHLWTHRAGQDMQNSTGLLEKDRKGKTARKGLPRKGCNTGLL